MICQVCGKFKRLTPKRDKVAKVCGWKCRSQWMKRYVGKTAGHWKGGKHIGSQGYIVLRINKKYIYEHRYKMSLKLGRKLHRKEIVHHKNGNRTDNRLSNLILISHLQHNHIHQNHWKRWNKNLRKGG